MCEICIKNREANSTFSLKPKSTKFAVSTESNSLYKASLTREQFLFFEMRTLAILIYDKGLSENEAVQSIIENNLFQYPTSRSLSRNANTCLRRLHSLGIDLAKMLVHASVTTAKQICFYAMMKQHRLVRDFAVEVSSPQRLNQLKARIQRFKRGNKRKRSSISERRMSPNRIIFSAKNFDQGSSFFKRIKHFSVEQFIA